MIRLSTLPFTTNLESDQCDLCWVGNEGYPLWTGADVCYDKEKRIVISGSIADPRPLPELREGGIWGSYSSLVLTEQFYYPRYIRTYVISAEHRGVPRSVLEVIHSFTHGLTAASNPRPFFPRYLRVHLEERPDFPEIEHNLQCADALRAWSGGLRDKILSRVEVFVIKGEADPSFVKQHSETRHAEWLNARGK
jgi:hypothetical protein